MDKRTVITLGIILTVVVGGISALYFIPSANDAMKKNIEATISDAESSSKTQSNTQPVKSDSPGQYIDYSEESLASAQGTKLLFFHAPWCPQCRELDADINKQGVPNGITILKVDYDTNQKLRQKYGVTIQTTIVKVDDQGNLIKKYVAYSEPTLKSVTDNL